MKTLLLLLAGVLALGANAQKQLPEQFETANDTADWEMFENGTTNPDNFVVVENPDKTGINDSDSCLQFTVVDEAQPWAGAFSKSFGEIEITNDNFLMYMMVNKNVTSRCLIKLEKDDGTFVEIFAENTITDQWEELEFDFYDYIGETYTTIVFFPDFPETREQGSICFVDNIGWPQEEATAINSMENIAINMFPNPAKDNLTIQSTTIIKNLQVYDVAGKLVLNKECNNAVVNLNTSEFTKGLYLVKTQNIDGQSITKKLEIE